MSNEFVWCLGEAQSTSLVQFGHGHAVARGEAYQPGSIEVPGRRSGGPPKNVSKKGRRASSAKQTVTAEAVLRSFNTWAFKREQPADPQLMSRMISEAIALAEPVSFILYWGKGPRCRIGEPDIACLDYLGAFAQRVGDVYAPGATIGLIFTDTHAALNGHAPQEIQAYFTEVQAGAGERGFSTCWLSELTRSTQAAAAFSIDDQPVPQEMLQRLSTSAGKWYRGDGTAADGARKYFRMNMIEKRAVEIAFPRSIFVTFNGSDLRCLFPDHLPIFYMYSLRRGVSVKPWFLPAPGTEDTERTDLP